MGNQHDIYVSFTPYSKEACILNLALLSAWYLISWKDHMKKNDLLTMFSVPTQEQANSFTSSVPYMNTFADICLNPSPLDELHRGL